MIWGRGSYMFKIAVCDDEKHFRNTVKEYVGRYLKQKGIAYEIDTFSSGEEFVDQGIEMIQYKIIFLDINMNELDGIKTAQKIRELSKDVFIVFVTAYVNYTLEGYKVDAVRYLLKNNVNFDDSINECMDAITLKMNYKEVKKEFKFSEGIKKISLNKILYIESNLHKLEFQVMEDKLNIYTLYDTLNNMEKELKDEGFIRVHQSFLVNIKHIKSMKRYEVVLSNHTTLAIPKARYKSVNTIFISYKGEF